MQRKDAKMQIRSALFVGLCAILLTGPAAPRERFVVTQGQTVSALIYAAGQGAGASVAKAL